MEDYHKMSFNDKGSQEWYSLLISSANRKFFLGEPREEIAWEVRKAFAIDAKKRGFNWYPNHETDPEMYFLVSACNSAYEDENTSQEDILELMALVNGDY